MVESSYKQHLRVAGSPKASPVFVDGSRASQVRVGSGNIGNIQAARPVYAQYIPAPTDHGAKTMQMVAGLSEQINTMALEIADAESTAKAAQLIKADSAMVDQLAYRGADGNGGIFTKERVEFLDTYATAKEELRNVAASRASGLEPDVRSKYITGMEGKFVSAFKQIDSKYLLELADAKKESVALRIGQDVSAAVQATTPKDGIARLNMAIAAQTVENAMVSPEQAAAGVVDQGAKDSVIKQFIGDMLGYPDASAALAPYAGWIKANASGDVAAYMTGKSGDALVDRVKVMKAEESLAQLQAKEMTDAASNKMIKAIVKEQVPSVRNDMVRAYAASLDIQHPGKGLGNDFIAETKAISGDVSNDAGLEVLATCRMQGMSPAEAQAAIAESPGAYVSRARFESYQAAASPAIQARYKRADDVVVAMMAQQLDVTTGVDMDRRRYFTKGSDKTNDTVLAKLYSDFSGRLESAARQGKGAVDEELRTIEKEITSRANPVSENLYVPATNYFAANDTEAIRAYIPDYSATGGNTMPTQLSIGFVTRLSKRANGFSTNTNTVPVSWGEATRIGKITGDSPSKVFAELVAAEEYKNLAVQHDPSSSIYRKKFDLIRARYAYCAELAMPGGSE